MPSELRTGLPKFEACPRKEKAIRELRCCASTAEALEASWSRFPIGHADLLPPCPILLPAYLQMLALHFLTSPKSHATKMQRPPDSAVQNPSSWLYSLAPASTMCYILISMSRPFITISSSLGTHYQISKHV